MSDRNSLPRWPGAAAVLLGVTVLGGALQACGGGRVPLPDLSPASAGDTSGLIARGEYIVRDVAVCGQCHAADPRSGRDGPLSGGLEFRDWRLGKIRAANLTPDSVTGIGAWSEAELVRAIRTGVDDEGDVLAPIMPYAWFHGMSERDALAVARYLKSQPPVRHAVRDDHNLIFALGRPFIRAVKGSAESAPPRGPTPEYGRYLANHVALCAECHTPRGGFRSTPRLDRLFAGTADPPKGFPANPANLTPDTATGIGRWSEADFIRTLRTGVDPRGDTLHAFMPWRQSGRMTDDDLRAIYRYLRTLRPIHNAVPMRMESMSGAPAHAH